MSLTIPETIITREELMKTVVFHANTKDYIIFGGYVRDVHILNIPAKDIDIPVEGDNQIKDLIGYLQQQGIGFTKTSIVQNKYEVGSNNIVSVSNYKLSWYKGIKIKDNAMQFSIDFIILKCNFENWKRTKDLDYSCNLFMKTKYGITIRYIPEEYYRYLDELNKEIDAFEYYSGKVKEKIITIVDETRKIYGYRFANLLTRTNKFVKAGYVVEHKSWSNNYFRYDTIDKFTDELDKCSICHTDYNKDSKVISLWCNHLFCLECITKYMKSLKIKTPKCPLCRSEFSQEKSKYIDMESESKIKGFRTALKKLLST